MRWPFWKVLLVANGALLVIACIAMMLSGPVDLLEVLPQAVLMVAAYCTPITTVAYFSTGLMLRITRELPRSVRGALLVLTWLISGMAGSLITYAALYYVVLDNGKINPPSTLVTPVLITNGVVAIGIGTFIFLVELMRGRYRERTAILGEQDLLTAELQAARNVQRSLLPSEDLVIAGFDISGTTEPAVEIGGDYYDYISFADGAKGILVADAAGKGVPAALVMAKFQGMAQALSIHVTSAEELFTGLNDTLQTRLDRRSFITVGMVTIDLDDQCRFYRAGHNPLLLYRGATGSVETSRPPGMALGLMHGLTRRAPAEPAPFIMEKGDYALLYSDGLTEATDREGVPFGEERVEEALCAAAREGLGARATQMEIVAKLAAFVGDTVPHDDVTVVVVRKV